MKTTSTIALASLIAALTLAVPTIANAQTVVTTTTSEHHFVGGNHWLWRHGLNSPFGFGRGNNIVVIPAQTLSNSVVNNCPITAPVLLSTGQCITQQQAIYLEQTGQLQVGGTVTGLGQTVIGTPVVIGAHGWDNPFGFFHHFHQSAANHAAREAAEAANTP